VTAQASDGQTHCLMDGYMLAQQIHLEIGTLRPSECLGCECSAPVISCPDQDETILKDDVRRSGEAWVHAHVKPGLDGPQFDALVDLALHHGSIDQPFIDEMNKYWCSSRAGITCVSCICNRT